MNRNSLATVLMCTSIGYNDNYPPLKADEWDMVLLALKRKGLTPEALLELDAPELINRIDIDEGLRRKLILRLNNIDTICEKTAILECLDVDAVTTEDIEFPVLIKKVCKSCPPLLYFAGNLLLANTPSTAILGSRGTVDEDIEIAKQLAQRAIESGKTIITGGGNGIDLEIERYAYANGGKVVQYCGGDLVKKINNPFYREQLKKGTLLILSEVTPLTDFSLKFAVDRNKYIYCCALHSFVIKATEDKCTFNGAMEAIENGYCDVYCWDNPAYTGNQRLIQAGAFPFSVKKAKE